MHRMLCTCCALPLCARCRVARTHAPLASTATQFLQLTPRASQAWNAFIIFVDAFYTALWLPVVATFEYEDEIRGLAGAILSYMIFVRPNFDLATWRSEACIACCLRRCTH